MRDYDKEIAALTSQIQQLDAGVQENLRLEESLGEDAVTLQAELGSPAVALDLKAFGKINDAIAATHVKKASTQRALTAISKARSELEAARRNVESAKHCKKGVEYGKSALEMADELDREILPQLKETVKALLDFINATAACMGQANDGHRDRVYDPKDFVAMTLAGALREAGLDVEPGYSIRTLYSSYLGLPTLNDALAEFRAAVELPAR